ncbi:MAG: putative inorganic carbon transporter subunit DabA [Caldilineaceae bacterium]
MGTGRLRLLHRSPRARTQSLDLGGRAFLLLRLAAGQRLRRAGTDHDRAHGGGQLDQLQYCASTVDNRVFGSGNKALHNVVGALGVLEGNGGDLRLGLPWQSVHDGERYIHEPLRLNVLIGTPIEAMNDIIARHEGVRQLLDNGWVHLFALDEDGTVSRRYVGDLRWRSVAEEEATVVEGYQAANHWLN